MEQKDMQRLPLRLLLNAEPFGFGPTAAIATFMPHLRPHFEKIGYMGKKHTLDLQRGLPYDAIHDMTSTPKDEREEAYWPVFAEYDVLLTAMDHKVAEQAQKAGLKVFYYDALTWYWPQIPESVQKSDLYLAQNFFGVEDRLRDVFARHAAAFPVSPIVQQAQQSKEREHVLINLGGLQNPFWPIDDVIDYARSVIQALRKAIPADEKILIAGSKAVADALKDEGVKTYPHNEMQDVIARSKVAFMTPGLGNIYDAAAWNTPTIWLPPANDSQGQQLDLIDAKGMSDARLNWPDIIDGAEINYREYQPDVLAKIAKTATQLANDPQTQACLSDVAGKCYGIVAARQESSTAKIIDLFGRGGEQQVAHLVIEQARGYCHV